MTKTFYNVFIPDASRYGILTRQKDQYLEPMRDGGKIDNWEPYTLNLTNGDLFGDYIISSMGRRICSEKLKNILSEFTCLDLKIQWVPVYAQSVTGEKKTYFRLHFIEFPDVLDNDKTTFSPSGKVECPKYAYEKIKNFDFFTHSSFSFVVSEKVKKRIQEEGCTNIIFERAPVTYKNQFANHE